MEAKYALFTVVDRKQVRIEVIPKKTPVCPKGASTFYVRYTDPDTKKRITRKLGTNFVEAVGEINAYTIAQECKDRGVEAPKGVEAPAPVVRGDQVTLKIDEYLGLYTGKSYHAYRRSLELFRVSCKVELVGDVAESDINRFLAYLREPKHDFSPRTIYNNFLNVVSFLKWAGKRFEELKWPTFRARDPEAYTKEQVIALLGEATAEEKLILECFLSTGVRSGELANLRYVDVQPPAFVIRSSRKRTTKTEESDRDVPVPQHVLDKIAARKRESDFEYVFATRGGKPDGHLIRIVKRVAKRLGWKIATAKNPDSGIRVDDHKFRSTAITTWIEMGHDLKKIQVRVGHANLEMLERYYRKASARTAQAQQEVTEALAYLQERKPVTPIRKRRAA